MKVETNSIINCNPINLLWEGAVKCREIRQRSFASTQVGVQSETERVRRGRAALDCTFPLAGEILQEWAFTGFVEERQLSFLSPPGEKGLILTADSKSFNFQSFVKVLGMAERPGWKFVKVTSFPSLFTSCAKQVERKVSIQLWLEPHLSFPPDVPSFHDDDKPLQFEWLVYSEHCVLRSNQLIIVRLYNPFQR